MRLYHYSADKLILDKNRSFAQRTFHKPRGLWLSVDREWHKWLYIEWREEFDSIQYESIFDINMSNILSLSSYEELLSFTNKYGDRDNRGDAPLY